MARVSIVYSRFSNCRLATFLSFVGGFLSSLCILPGITLFGMSVLQLLTGGFADTEIWINMGKAVLILAVGFGFSVIFKLIFDKLAEAVASRKNRMMKRPSK